MATECCSHRDDSDVQSKLSKELLQKCEPEVGHRVLTGRLRPLLEKYQETGNASVRDKQICSDLLKALELTGKLSNPQYAPPPISSTRPLPPIAIPSGAVRQDAPVGSERAASRHYTTSYQAAFKPTDSQLLPAITKSLSPKRLGSNYPFGSSYSLGDPVGSSTYDREFNRNGDAASDRRGLKIGESRNNPHPLESFMVWRFPRDNIARGAAQSQQDSKSPERFYPANEDVEQAYEPLRLSTYRLDYQKAADAAQAVRLSQRAGKPISFFKDDDKVTRTVSEPPFSRNTTQRSSYHAFNDINEALRPSTTRYGSNANKSIIFPGIAPTVSELRLQVTTRTHYDQEVNDRAIDVYEELSTRSTIPRGRHVKRPPSTIVPELPEI